jgi:hypothetical protein
LTNTSVVGSSARSSLAVAAFLALVFVGDVWLVKLTLPLSMLLLPFIFVVFRPYELRSLPVGILLLLGMLVIACLQAASGMSMNVKADLAMWRPTVYAVATIFCLSAVFLTDDQLKSAIFVGGITTGAIMLAMILFAPPDFYLLPGQNVSQVAAKFQAEGHAGVAAQFSPELSAGSKAFYGLKNKARNLLGGSNYIAVFLVFVFTVAVFTRSRVVAILMAALAITTMARFGALCLVAAAGSYFAHKRGIAASRICVWILAAGVFGIMALYLVGPHLAEVAESVTVRSNFMRSGVEIAEAHPLFGAPRSLILEENGFNIVWSPHCSVLQMAVYFGIAGVALYAAYVWSVFRTLSGLSGSSDLWAGISVGLSIAFAWSLLEIIVITPAFEILVASLYALATKKLAMASRPISTFRSDT